MTRCCERRERNEHDRCAHCNRWMPVTPADRRLDRVERIDVAEALVAVLAFVLVLLAMSEACR